MSRTGARTRECASGSRTLAGAGTPQDPAKAAACRQHGDDPGQLARCCRKRTSVRGKGGIPQRPVVRAEIPPVLGRSCAGGAPRFRRFRFTCGSGAYFRICKPQRARLWLSGVCCAARWTAGRGSSSALPAEAVVTARPAPTPRRRPPRWRAWPEGSCPSAHPASSRASPRPSR